LAEQWVLGFISAHEGSDARNATESIFCETNDRDVIRRVDSYCRSNKRSFVIQGALIVTSDLMREKAATVLQALQYKQKGLLPPVACWPAAPPD
jgi:hypothetical protein